MKRQALLCHRVLRTIESVARESAILTRDTWETLLKFLLAANDSLLSPPTEKGVNQNILRYKLLRNPKIWLCVQGDSDQSGHLPSLI